MGIKGRHTRLAEGCVRSDISAGVFSLRMRCNGSLCFLLGNEWSESLIPTCIHTYTGKKQHSCATRAGPACTP